MKGPKRRRKAKASKISCTIDANEKDAGRAKTLKSDKAFRLRISLKIAASWKAPLLRKETKNSAMAMFNIMENELITSGVIVSFIAKNARMIMGIKAWAKIPTAKSPRAAAVS